MEIWHAIEEIDSALLVLINHGRSDLLNWLMPVLSDFQVALPLVVLILSWRLWKGTNRERIMWVGLVAAIVLADMLCARVLKTLVDRPRPFFHTDGIYVMRDGRWIRNTLEAGQRLKGSLSWPSCHAMNIWTFAAYTGAFSMRWGLAAMVLAVGVCYSRIYLGVHYPLDVVGGGFLGTLVGVAAAALVKTVQARYMGPPC